MPPAKATKSPIKVAVKKSGPATPKKAGPATPKKAPKKTSIKKKRVGGDSEGEPGVDAEDDEEGAEVHNPSSGTADVAEGVGSSDGTSRPDDAAVLAEESAIKGTEVAP